MKKRCFQIVYTFLLILFSASMVYASAPDTLWTKKIGDGESQNAYAVFPTSDGGFMIGGHTTVSGLRDFYMVKTDGEGEVIWEKTFGQDDRFESANWMIETTDGGYILAGSRAQDPPNSSKTDIYLVKTDADGDQQWYSIIGYDSISESTNCITQTSDGGYIMCGSYWATSQTGFDVLLIKTNSEGLQEWRQVLSLEDGMADYALGVEQASDGGYLVTGKTQAFSGDYTHNAYILKTNLVGDFEWIQTYGGSWPWYETSYHIMHTSDGGYFLSGNQSNDGLDKNWFLVKTNGDGIELWTDNSIGGTYHDGAFYACETFDGGYAVTGNVHQDVWKPFIAKFNIDGDTLWTKMWGTGDDNSQYNYVIHQLEDGGYITVGSTTTNSGDIDVYLSRLEADQVGVLENKSDTSNSVCELYDNRPNPFSNNTIIPYMLLCESDINISIYNAFGQKVEEFVNTVQSQGEYEVEFNSKNYPSGIYFCMLSTGDKILSRKLILQKGQ